MHSTSSRTGLRLSEQVKISQPGLYAKLAPRLVDFQWWPVKASVWKVFAQPCYYSGTHKGKVLLMIKLGSFSPILHENLSCVTHKNNLSKVILKSTHNIKSYGKLSKNYQYFSISGAFLVFNTSDINSWRNLYIVP